MSNDSILSHHYWLEHFWVQHGDPRRQEYPFTSSMRPVLSVLALYLSFVLFVGPRAMQNRKPFSLKPMLIVYNLFMSLMNGYFMYHILVRCDPLVDMFDMKFRPTSDRTPQTLFNISMNYLFVCSKFIDLFDTIFFVLRKKHSQITGLHVYHHTSVALLSWVYFNINCAFQVTTFHFAFWNTFIHVLMYGYYGLSALGPAMQPFLWWKRYLTQLQILQFVSIFLHGLYFCVYQQDYPLFFSVDIMIQSVLYLWLFGRFYVNTYHKKQKQTTKLE